MRDENPAALPLAGLIAGIALTDLLLDPRKAAIAVTACALLSLALRQRRVVTVLFLSIAIGLIAGTRERSVRAAEETILQNLDAERFSMVVAPVDRDWSRRGSSSMLRVARFSIDGIAVDQPLRIYMRDAPPPIGLSSTVRVEGFVRSGARGATMSVKSARLIKFDGTVPAWTPAGWNRRAATRTARWADVYPDAVALVDAIILGRGERLSDSMREGFRSGGTYHLLVFSGLQISFAAAVLALLLRFTRSPRAADWLLLAFAALAPPFIGWTPSVSRAAIAIALYALSRIAGRPTSFENLWCLSAVVRLIIAPAELLEAGFHLTYAGAGALIFIGKPLAARFRHRWLGYALAAEIALTPVMLFHFHQYALGGSLATLAMTPVIFAILVLSAIFCIAPLEPLLVMVEWLHMLCVQLNNVGASASGFFAAPALAALVAAGVLTMAALILLRGGRRAAAIALVFIIPSASALHRHLSSRSVTGMQLTALDVGQGDSLLLRHGRSTILVDGGGRNDDARFGESTLLPLLVDRGVQTIDAVVLTHAHPDHCGGLPAVIEHLEVREVWVSPRRFRGDCATSILASLRGSNAAIRLIREGPTRVVGAMRATALPSSRSFRRSPDNNSSVVLRVEAEGRRILLTGDVEREAELDLLDRDLRADILKVPHHGSRSSTSPLFLEAVAPRVAVVSCGRRNLFHHPHGEVLDRLSDSQARLYRTDRHGTVELVVLDGVIRATTQIDTPQ